MKNVKQLTFRPYARLLTMLGDQLIKDEKTALVELIKNSYDADATEVTISFKDFTEDWGITDTSRIVIKDDGIGMSEETVETVWMRPATPAKKSVTGEPRRTKKRRIMQGEKGIGRFAMLKLGQQIRVITRAIKSPSECVLDLDFSSEGDEFLGGTGAEPKFLDAMYFPVQTRIPRRFKEEDAHGTCIEIRNLNGRWADKEIRDIAKEIAKLQIDTDLFSFPTINHDKFDVSFDKDGDCIAPADAMLASVKTLCHERAVLRIDNGQFDNEALRFSCNLNGEPLTISLKADAVKGLEPFRMRFLSRIPNCGSFSFALFVFDFAKNAPIQYQLDRESKELIGKHRVYLYRDGIRVYPYGDQDDDWLGIDVSRGTKKAGDYFSNDQLVGCINISKKDNPKVKDKTNREGLIRDNEGAVDDLIAVMRLFIEYLFTFEYTKYKIRKERKIRSEQLAHEVVFNELNEVVDKLSSKGDSTTAAQLKKVVQKYRVEKDELSRRADVVEELAAVGLSVETASHDMMIGLSRVIGILNELTRRLLSGERLENNFLLDELNKCTGLLGFIESQLKDMQMVFRSSKQRARLHTVKTFLDKIASWYLPVCKKKKIEFDIRVLHGPVVATCTEAVLLQLFINLFDNAIYWLDQVEGRNRCIRITLEGDKQQLIFSDNGPGVPSDFAPYIFDAFVSGKGSRGRGLGLYIARQLLGRYGYNINLASSLREKVLPGANFIVSFIEETVS